LFQGACVAKQRPGPHDVGRSRGEEGTAHVYCRPEQPTCIEAECCLQFSRLDDRTMATLSRPASLAARQRSLVRIRKTAAGCTRCPLFRNATQTVFGEGRADSRVMFVGEQPGDREDIEGHPFVGPAGLLLRDAITRAGLAMSDVYLTNAVKHFKWEPRGKRRIHKRPDQREAAACRVWLDDEIALVKPRALIVLGATAASVLLPPGLRVMRDRGRIARSPLAEYVALTVHPSAILRVPDRDARHAALDAFVADLRKAAAWLARNGATPSTG
jgi:DNA polymerase